MKKAKPMVTVTFRLKEKVYRRISQNKGFTRQIAAIVTKNMGYCPACGCKTRGGKNGVSKLSKEKKRAPVQDGSEGLAQSPG